MIGPIVDGHVAGQRHAVGQDHVAADVHSCATWV